MKAWICAGLFLAAFGLFMVFIGWPAIIQAALREADTRYMQRVMIGISESDKRCLEWAQRVDGAWICIRR